MKAYLCTMQGVRFHRIVKIMPGRPGIYYYHLDEPYCTADTDLDVPPTLSV